MKTRQDYIDILRANLGELSRRFDVRSLVLFGSVARDEHREGSDVDLFVDMPPKFLQVCAAADYIEDLLGCKVDFVRDHKHLSEFFRQQIAKDGIQITATA